MKIKSSTIHFQWLLIVVLWVCFSSGCNLMGKSCEELNQELKDAYNAYNDHVSPLSEAQLVETCQKALKKCPDLSIAYELMGIIDWDAGRTVEALANYTRAVELAPDNEYTVMDARILAFESGQYHLSVDENGRVDLEPFQRILLETYAACPNEIRMQWCAYSLNKREDPSKTQDVVDQYGRTLGSRSISVSFDILTSKQLDASLLEEARYNPQAALSKTTSDQLMKGVVSTDAYINPNALVR